jgi:hypothetical protein
VGEVTEGEKRLAKRVAKILGKKQVQVVGMNFIDIIGELVEVIDTQENLLEMWVGEQDEENTGNNHL